MFFPLPQVVGQWQHKCVCVAFYLLNWVWWLSTCCPKQVKRRPKNISSYPEIGRKLKKSFYFLFFLMCFPHPPPSSSSSLISSSQISPSKNPNPSFFLQPSSADTLHSPILLDLASSSGMCSKDSLFHFSLSFPQFNPFNDTLDLSMKLYVFLPLCERFQGFTTLLSRKSHLYNVQSDQF